VIIYRATGVINFAQGGLVALGAYFTYTFSNGAMLPFVVAVILAVVCASLVGAGIERVVLRHMVGEPVFAVIMVTIGLLYIIQQVVTWIWGFDALNLRDPWGVSTVKAGGIVMATKDLWTLAIAAAILAGFFAFFRYSTLGVAMRATAMDAEAALAQGISARRVYAVSWAISAGLAALAGVTLASGAAALTPSVGDIALVAFPAMIVGGLDSPAGAVLGGMLIGLTQALTSGYQDDVAPWLGDNFASVMPFVVMIVILLVRPYGLLGTREVRRV
jgi:branched-chain amino acid transport system permease protein